MACIRFTNVYNYTWENFFQISYDIVSKREKLAASLELNISLAIFLNGDLKTLNQS